MSGKFLRVSAFLRPGVGKSYSQLPPFQPRPRQDTAQPRLLEQERNELVSGKISRLFPGGLVITGQQRVEDAWYNDKIKNVILVGNTRI
ncbi:MAG: hypothetical protein JWM68_1763 [Verrucomicrobiales bacterium]|nr:hypothetical protein [Verrucomicrobiales bacterium]